MALPPSPAIELSESDVLPIVDEWAPADSIPLLELSAIMEEPVLEDEAEPVPRPEPVEVRPQAAATALAPIPEPIPTAPRSRPKLLSAAIASLSTSAPIPVTDPSPSDSVVAWKPRRSFSWIMGCTAAASVAVILMGWALAPSSANAEPATQVEEPAPVVLQAELAEPEPEPVVAPEPESTDSRTAARKWATIGNRQLKDGNTATAAKMFERALEAQANNRMAHAGLGKIALRRKQPRRAVEHLRLAVKIEPRNAENRRLLGQAYMAQGRTDKARKHLEKAIAYGDQPAQQLLMDL